MNIIKFKEMKQAKVEEIHKWKTTNGSTYSVKQAAEKHQLKINFISYMKDNKVNTDYSMFTAEEIFAILEKNATQLLYFLAKLSDSVTVIPKH